MSRFLFTSESVSEGHPDKIADQISDGLLDRFLQEDRNSRVACAAMLTREGVIVGGEISSRGYVDLEQEVRRIIKNIGYDHKDKGLDYKSCSIQSIISKQSQDIAQGLGEGESQGAGDQGLVFGYAVDETKEYMPLSISLCHQLMKRLAEVRHANEINIWPDSKGQVTVEYEEDKITYIPSVVISTQHAPDVQQKTLEEFIREELIKKIIPQKFLNKKTQFFINPTKRFVKGGPAADCGLTGRKIIVDTYGGHGAHGGGSFSGKDPSKVDRSGAYVARHIAKNIVAAGLARKCLVQIAYVIGRPDPVSLMIEGYGTLRVPQESLVKIVKEFWDLRPASVISYYRLLEPIYHSTSVYGHFGREEPYFTWEKLEKVSALKSAFPHLAAS